MDRKAFIKKCSWSCLGAFAGIVLLPSCYSAKYVDSTLMADNLIVDLSHFPAEVEGTSSIIVAHAKLKYPIVIFRKGEKYFKALLMKCTHQGIELRLYGDRLHCTAHGSQFSLGGEVLNGPASRSLRSFPTSVSNNQLIINLQ